MIEYKLIRKGGLLIKADKFFASTQLCSICGFKNPATKDLSVKKWTCPNCGHQSKTQDLRVLRNGGQNKKHSITKFNNRKHRLLLRKSV